MTSAGKPILVVAAILVREGRILICQRHHSDAYGMQWEFPGGKVRNGETLEAALSRELREELGMEADVGRQVHRLQHSYPDRFVEVIFFEVTGSARQPENRVFERIEWVARRDLPRYPFLEADRDLVEKMARGEVL